MSRRLCLGAVVLVGTVSLVAQQTPGSQAPAPAQALILGRVVDADSGAAVSGVVLGLSSDAPSSGRPRQVLTDAQGRFVFPNVSKGSYTIVAGMGGNGFSPSGFIVSGSGHQIGAYLNGGYGQRRPNGPLDTIELGETERVTDLVVRLWKGAAIDGTVFDEAGEPLVGLYVAAVRRSGDGRLLTGPTTRTDDRGAYHLGTLVPGEYLVVVPQLQVLMPLSTVEAATVTPLDPGIVARLASTSAP